MKNFDALALAAVLVCCPALAAAAGATSAAVMAATRQVQEMDFGGAVATLEEAARQGDVAASGYLSSVLRHAPAPTRDQKRSCEIALIAANAKDPVGQMTYAECLLSGPTNDVPDRYERARQNAKMASRSGIPAAGFLNYLAFTSDPTYKYIGADGKANATKYEELAKIPLERRQDQIDALTSLGYSANANYAPAVYTLIALLLETSTPGNNQRALGLTGKLRPDANLPEQIKRLIGAAMFIEKIGGSHASAGAFMTAFPQALGLAAAAISKPDKCDATQVRLESSAPSRVDGATYLPLEIPLLRESYLLTGQWTEQWMFAGCGRNVSLNVTFTADGWGGASHAIRIRSAN